MRLFFLKSTPCAVSIVQIMAFLIPVSAAAITRWNGAVSMGDTYVATPTNTSNLFTTDLNIDIKPATKKQLNSRFNVRLNFTESDQERLWNLAPIGNLGVDLAGPAYSFNSAHSNYATVSSTAELVETQVSRAALSFNPQNLPRLGANYSSSTVSSVGRENQSDILSLFTDYNYKLVNFRGGYSAQERSMTAGNPSRSSTLFLGTGGSFMLVPGTTLTCNVDVDQSDNESSQGAVSSSLAKALRTSVTSLLSEWLTLNGNFSQDDTEYDAGGASANNTSRRNMDIGSRLYPVQRLELSSIIGKREFDDVDRARSISYWTVGTSYRDYIGETIEVGANYSHTAESDPDQGDNLRDNFGVNTTMDLTARIAARVNLNVGKSEIAGFVSSGFFDAAGTLVERDEYDDRPVGFIFYDVENNDLYTRISEIEGEWSDPEHKDPVLQQYSVSKTAQFNMILTDKSSMNIAYSSNSNGATVDIVDLGSQTVIGSLWYRPNLRTNYSLTGSVNLPQSGNDSFGTTMTMSYRFFRGHRMSMSYGNRKYADRTTSTFSTSLRFELPKKMGFEIIYSSSELFLDEQADFVRASLSKSF